MLESNVHHADNEIVRRRAVGLDHERTLLSSHLGQARTEFHVFKPTGWPEGKYKVEVSLNGALAGSKDFEVKRG